MTHSRFTLLALSLCLCAGLMPKNHARAALPDEIQVYTEDIGKAGETGLDIHINTTPRGQRQASYVGETVNHHGLRITPEWAYSFTDTVEGGLYLPLVRAADGNTRVAGVKLRLKWLPFTVAEEQNGAYAGVNFELGRVAYRYDDRRSKLEVRGISGYKNGHWNFSFNPIVDLPLSDGPLGRPTTLILAARAAYQFSKQFAVAVEHYADMGELQRFSPLPEQAHQTFLVSEWNFAPGWALHTGVGYGAYAADRWTVKAILTVPF